MNTTSAPSPASLRRRRAVVIGIAVVLLLAAAALAWDWWQRGAAAEDPRTLLLYGNVDQRQKSQGTNLATQSLLQESA
ncbi:MAG TPA: hypothetical protein PLO41_24565, partial [Rubrivivax sp.]|nr:hypothetical protein [Rubrivivax sp.]